jgi:hypothetical protein
MEADVTGFDRYAPAQAAFFAAFGFSVPIFFAAVVIQGGSPVTPDQYGEFVYSIPAVAWAGMQFALGVAASISAAARWPIIHAGAAFLFFALMAFFAAAAIIAGPSGTLVVAGAGFGVAPLAIISAAIAWRGRNER